MKGLENSLVDYSRQDIRVGTPPHFLWTLDGQKIDRELVGLSTMLRIANALEQAHWHKVYDALPSVNEWVLVTTDPRFEPVPMITAGLAPNGDWVDYDGNAIETPLAWRYLPVSAHRPPFVDDSHE